MTGEGGFQWETMSVLLVDDERRFLETTAKLMMRRGLRTFTAASGAEALRRLQAHVIHVVILDVKMPSMDGLTVLQHIRRRHPLVEVILLSGHGTAELTAEGLKRGAYDFLMKPVGVADMIRKAREAFQKRAIDEQRIRDARRDDGSTREGG